MHSQLTKLREKRANGEKGFTLIELLVVVVIIGILIAIAIPLYLNYKKGAADKSAQSDLRNAINTLEQCNTDNGSYPTALGASGGSPTGCSAQTINTSGGTVFTYFVGTAAAPNTAYDLIAWNTNGNTSATKYYCYSSSAGGSIATRTSTVPAAYVPACPNT